jgi:hypothetical protein
MQDRYELKIAGLLHDCGKVTTPVHVVDKATKLQTIFDRIELIDTRFELIRRDIQMAAMLRADWQRGRHVSAGASELEARSSGPHAGSTRTAPSCTTPTSARSA